MMNGIVCGRSGPKYRTVRDGVYTKKVLRFDETKGVGGTTKDGARKRVRL